MQPLSQPSPKPQLQRQSAREAVAAVPVGGYSECEDVVGAAAAAVPVRLWPAPGELGARLVEDLGTVAGGVSGGGRVLDVKAAAATSLRRRTQRSGGRDELSGGGIVGASSAVRCQKATATCSGATESEVVDLAGSESDNDDDGDGDGGSDANDGISTGGGRGGVNQLAGGLGGQGTAVADAGLRGRRVDTTGAVGPGTEAAFLSSAGDAVYDMLLQAFNAGAEGELLAGVGPEGRCEWTGLACVVVTAGFASRKLRIRCFQNRLLS